MYEGQLDCVDWFGFVVVCGFGDVGDGQCLVQWCVGQQVVCYVFGYFVVDGVVQCDQCFGYVEQFGFGFVVVVDDVVFELLVGVGQVGVGCCDEVVGVVFGCVDVFVVLDQCDGDVVD